MPPFQCRSMVNTGKPVEILMNLRGAPDLMWAAFPQAQQPGGVVDLAVGENNAPICVPRSTPALFNSGVWAICWLISGEALHSTHSLPLSLTIIDDWVRGQPEWCHRADPDSWRSCSSIAGNRRRRRNRGL